MKSKVYILYFFIIICSFSCQQENVDTHWPEITAEAKPWVRWWWMGSAVDKENLTWNLDQMSSAGLGGVEITPIYGVDGFEDKFIPYLSPEWMEMLEHTQSESTRLGMLVDMNTGTGWPFGGPEVSIEDAATKAIFQQYKLKAGERLQERIIVNDPRQQKVATLDCLMGYGANNEKLNLTEYLDSDGLLNWTATDEGEWQLIAVFTGKTFQQVKRPAPGGEGWVMNHLDAGAVTCYLDRFDKAFHSTGTHWPHGFFNDSYEVYGADWTPGFLSVFEKHRGYKLEEYLPELLADGENDLSRRVISDYRETISELLKENFSQAWTAWAHRHGATTRNQAHGSPANLIDIYASVDVPECETFGITDFDIPYLRKDSLRKENDGDPVTLKYASSAAHIAGKKYTSSETFTWLTEHFRTSLSQCKPEIDQMFLSGVNRVFFHGYTYAPQDAPWPGWLFYATINMSPTNSIWRDAPAFFDYITRVQSFLQKDRPDNDFLLYLPMYDMWNDLRGGHFLTFAIHGMREKLIDFYEAVENVRDFGYDLDYISDSFLQSATVENGLVKTVSGNTWKALIVPSAKMMPVETMKRIEELANQGATVIFAGHYPQEVPGLSSYEYRKSELEAVISNLPEVIWNQTEVNSYGKGKIITGEDYAQLLIKTTAIAEPFYTMGGRYLRKKHDGGYLYFLAMQQNKPVDGWVPLSVKAKSIMIFDPMTGKKGKAKTQIREGNTEVYLQLQPGESVILKTYTHTDINESLWTYWRESGNIINLSIGTNEEWVLIFEETSLQPALSVSISELISWSLLDTDINKDYLTTGRYIKQFNLQKIPGNGYKLSLGDVRESARIFVNGQEAGVVFAAPFELYVQDYLKDGINTIEIEVTNLPANRIADYDRQGINWRIFKDINIVDLSYRPANYAKWEPVPSGLFGPVLLKEELILE